jgi:Zn-dependent protease with chaperone function
MMRCPHCQSPDVKNRGRLAKLHPLATVVFLGVIGATMLRHAQPCRFHCRYCRADFSRRTLWGKCALIALIILIHIQVVSWLFALAGVFTQK